MSEHYVYIALETNSGLVKVGISETPYDRFDYVRRHTKGDVELVNIIDVDSKLVEQHLHEELDPWRHHGEWFAMPMPAFEKLRDTEEIEFADIAGDPFLPEGARVEVPA